MLLAESSAIRKQPSSASPFFLSLLLQPVGIVLPDGALLTGRPALLGADLPWSSFRLTRSGSHCSKKKWFG